MAWVLHHMAPACADERPSRLWWRGQAYRRRRKHRTPLATLLGPVVVWRRLYDPLEGGARAMHPLELRLGMEAGVATPALAERIGGWAVEPSQHQGLAMLAHDHGGHGSCTTLRKLLGRLRAGMAPHRPTAPVAQVVSWLQQARVSHGRCQPPLAVGRDGVKVPLRHGAWKAGATAPIAVLDRRGKRVGTVYVGQMPESGPTTLTTPLTALIQDILQHVAAQGLRLVYVSDDGYHPSDDYPNVLQQMHAPQRPWHTLAWIRIVDYSHACLDLQQLADAWFGPSPKGLVWAKQMRQHLKPKADGITRGLQSASTIRYQPGLWGPPKSSDQAYAYLQKRTHGMRYRHYSSQCLPMGSGIPEAACKIVLTQRLKRSGRSWTLTGGQVILDLRVIWLSGLWDNAHQRYVASQPLPVTQMDMAQSAQPEQQAA